MFSHIDGARYRQIADMDTRRESCGSHPRFCEARPLEAAHQASDD